MDIGWVKEEGVVHIAKWNQLGEVGVLRVEGWGILLEVRWSFT